MMQVRMAAACGRAAVFLFFVLPFIGCCRLGQHMRIVDRLEAVVVIGFDKPPKCVRPAAPFTGRQGDVDEPIALWLREVHFDDIREPLGGRTVSLDVVDAFGRVAKASEIIVAPNKVVTSVSGFNVQAVTVVCKVSRGEFLVRATYADKGSSAVSYSAPLLCRRK